MKRIKVLMVMVGFLCLLITGLAEASNTLALVEAFTSTTCGFCPPSNDRINQIVSDHPDMVAVVRYHMGFPSLGDPFYADNPTENNARLNYYDVGGIPFAKIGGLLDGTSYESYWIMIQNIYYMESAVEIDLNGGYDANNRIGRLDVTIRAIDYGVFENLRVRAALTESDIYFRGQNGENIHNQVMRDMLPSAAGTPIEIEDGQTVDLSLSFSIDQTINVENCELVVWLQIDNIQSTFVHQAAKIKPLELGPLGIDDEVKLPQVFNLTQNYPNPFNATTTISYSLSNESSVDLTVYDIAGRKVAQLVNGIEPAGEHQVVWNGVDDSGKEVATGIYFYNIKTDVESTTKRMMLLK